MNKAIGAIVNRKTGKIVAIVSVLNACLLLFAAFLWSRTSFGNTEKLDSSSTRAEFRTVEAQLSPRRNKECPTNLLIFNRVPKTGSEMMALLLQWLQDRNDFSLVRLGGNDERRLNKSQQDALGAEIAAAVALHVPLSGKLALDRHVYFLDASRLLEVRNSHLDVACILYFSAVRDPIEKAASRFYYKRATPRPENAKVARGVGSRDDDGSRGDDFEDCVRKSEPDCRFITGVSYDLTIPYFCGHEPECIMLNNKWALEQAKSNVERFYPVVAVLEHLNKSLALMERRIPTFFAGVQELYFHELAELKWNWNANRPRNLSDDVITALRTNLTMEYDFYNFVKQRLFEQLNSS